MPMTPRASAKYEKHNSTRLLDPVSGELRRDEDAIGIACPKCESVDLGVKDSRPGTFAGTGSVQRRRACNQCGHRWNTYEITDAAINPIITDTVNRVPLLALMQAALRKIEGTDNV